MQLGTLSWGRCSFTVLKILGSIRIVLNLLLLFSCLVVSDSLWPHELQHLQASLSLTISWSLPKFMAALVMPSSHLILWRPLLFLPSIFPSIRGFSSELALHIKWPKYWCFSFTISPSSEYSGLISFRIDWFDLLAIQGTLNSLQFKSINSSAFSLLYSSTLTFKHDHWKNHSFD